MKRIVILAGMLASLVASGEGPARSLGEFLKSAESRNFDQRIARLGAEKAGRDYVQAWSSLLPFITAQGQYGYNQYATILTLPSSGTTVETVTITPKNQWSGQFTLTVPILFASGWLRAAAAGKLSDAAKEVANGAGNQVQIAIVAAFYSYAGSLALEDSASKTMEVVQKQLEQSEVRFQAGAVTELEVLRARAEVERTRQALASAHAQAAISRRSLQTLSGLEAAADVKLPNDDMTDAAADSGFEERISLLPQLAASRLRAEAAGRSKDAAWLALVPTLSFFATEYLTNAAGFLGRSSFYVLGAVAMWRIDVPIFAAAKSAESTAAIARVQEEQEWANARDNVYKAQENLKAALLNVRAASAQVEATQRAQRTAKERYDVGAITQLDVISADRDAFQAEVGQIQARANLGVARATLRVASALPAISESAQ